MIEIHKEDLIPLREAPNHLPLRRGKQIHFSTVYRWATRGARGRILPTRMVGGVLYTTLSELSQFVETPTRVSCDDPRTAAIKRALYGKA